MSKHIPGPWTAKQLNGWGSDPIIWAEGWGNKPIATLVPHPDRFYRQISYKASGRTHTAITKETPEGEARKSEVASILAANARLIAAAPDLLTALKHCVIERSEWLEEARAAIAKAEG